MSQAHLYNGLIKILYSLYDRLALNMLHFPFFERISILFQAILNHYGKQSEVSKLKEIIHYLSALIYWKNVQVDNNNI